MARRIIFTAALMVCGLGVQLAHAQRVTFQNGVTPLGGGATYAGALDVEFASLNLLDPNPDSEEITVDGFDNGNATQAAIRFEGLLELEGGLLPDEISSGEIPIRRAFLTIYKASPSRRPGAPPNIEFHRVIGVDKTSGQLWQEDNTWAQLVDVLATTPAGFPQEFPFDGGFNEDGMYEGDGVEIGSSREFVDPIEPRPGDENGWYVAGVDSQDILNLYADELGANNEALDIEAAFDGFKQSFFNYDVTTAVTDWLVNGQLNGGWAITNDTTDGWDFLASEVENAFGEGYLRGRRVIEGLETPGGFVYDSENLVGVPGFEGLAYGPPVLDPDTEEIIGQTAIMDGLYLRPQLTVVFGENAADLDYDGDADEVDLRLFLESYGVQRTLDVTNFNDIAARADLDFDGDVDPADWLLFKDDFQQFFGAASLGGLSLAAQTIPEPATAALLSLSLAAFSALGGRRRSSDRR